MSTDKAMVTEAMVEAALTAFNKAVNDPMVLQCERCEGRGYHHGFGEHGHDPDWCEVCGGGGHNIAPGEEGRAMRIALEAALNTTAESHLLVWKAGSVSRRSVAEADGRPMYEVGFYQGEWYWVHNWFGLHKETAASEDEAKAAAQADYERRILTALAHPPAKREAGEAAAPVQDVIARHRAVLDRIEPHFSEDWTVSDTETAGAVLSYLGIGQDASKEPSADPRRDFIARIIRARIDAATPQSDALPSPQQREDTR